MASLACGGAGERLVERLEVRLALLPDGSLEVHETWIVDVEPSTPWTFTRKLSRDHHDGLSGLQATPPAAVEQGKAPSVSWAIGPGWGAGLQSLSVRYVAANALALGPGRARVSWPLLLPNHRWRIKQAYLHFESPAGVAPVTPGGIAEPGWRVTEQPTGVQAIRANVGPGEPVTVSFEFSRDALKLQEPRWQFLAERAEEFKPAFASAAAFILIVGLAVLGLMRVLVSEQAREAAAARLAKCGRRLSGARSVAGARREADAGRLRPLGAKRTGVCRDRRVDVPDRRKRQPARATYVAAGLQPCGGFGTYAQ